MTLEDITIQTWQNTGPDPLGSRETHALHGLRSGAVRDATIDHKGLEAELQRTIEGEVRFDRGSRALYSTDASNYRQIPIGVVVPKSKDDVAATVAAARKFGAPILSRGGGTSLAGECCNTAVIMDFTKYMHHVLEVDPQRKIGRVQPGCVLDDLRNAAEKYQLTFGPDPATHNHCTLGGMTGNNSCGMHAQMAGRTAENIEELEILLYDGTRMTVGKTSEEELERIIRAGGRKGEIYGKLKALRDKYADKVRECFPDIPRRVSGYCLEKLLPENGFHVAQALVGTEATCVTYLEITGRLVWSPPARTLVLLGYPDIYSAADHVPEILPFKPIALEGIDDLLIGYYKKKGELAQDIKLLPEGGGWLVVQFGGHTREEADAQARKMMDALKGKKDAPSMKLYDDPAEEQKIWDVRESSLGATAFVPGEPDTWPGWEDSACPPDRMGDYLRDLRKLFNKHGYNPSLYGHFGQGCIHCRVPFELTTHEGLENYRSFMNEAVDLVVRYGGSLSGEHGDGQARGEFLPRMYGEELYQAFREFKAIWDPDNKMNPGKVVDAYKITDNLRLGVDYNPPQLETHFKYPADKGTFSHAVLRCVGVGKCRREGGGTMCPSYMVTREEKHSTRGRARMLFEMLNGQELQERWKSKHVKDALDLCLSCKGCKGDCPVNVDMATYKAEFLSHYYQGRLRPRHAYAFGLIHWWSRLGGLMPGVVNLFNHAPILSSVMKALVGMEPRRDVPEFAPYTFRQWFKNREAKSGNGEQGTAGLIATSQPRRGLPPSEKAGGRSHTLYDAPAANQPSASRTNRVVLWPDTFNDHYHPTTAQAAVEVLEAAGCQVVVPMTDMCCGRPLYDYGMLDMAKRWLLHIMETLKDEIEAGTPIVVLEPSCATVFRDELTNLFPQLEDAKRLSRQTFLLSEYLEKHLPDYQPPKLQRKALLHGHCHHKSIMKMDDEESLLKKMGVDYRIPEDGCCGMAGAFGFEQGDHYDVSMKCGERMLLPEIRKEADNTLIITDGFSCREQIRQDTKRTPLHLAQVMQMALRDGEQGTPGDLPEQQYVHEPKTAAYYVKTAVILGVGALAVGGGIWVALKGRRTR
jgi:FAD/FMN-containing dehydrogenase/Fe-S oxidoreductase